LPNNNNKSLRPCHFPVSQISGDNQTCQEYPGQGTAQKASFLCHNVLQRPLSNNEQSQEAQNRVLQVEFWPIEWRVHACDGVLESMPGHYTAQKEGRGGGKARSPRFRQFRGFGNGRRRKDSRNRRSFLARTRSIPTPEIY